MKNIRNILQEIHLLLVPDKEHKKVFPDVPVIMYLEFDNGKSWSEQPYLKLMKPGNVNHVRRKPV